MTAEQVARPVYAIERPASMALQVRVARALKVLYGPCKVTDNGPVHVFWTMGEICACMDCCARLEPFLEPSRDNRAHLARTLPNHPDATRAAPEHEIADDYERNEHR